MINLCHKCSHVVLQSSQSSSRIVQFVVMLATGRDSERALGVNQGGVSVLLLLLA
jgi:hypothetical protein